uniref:Uncharacterized protein n=1 Tax=Tetranychus urticae TaxID=32264 RepID=T1KR35_TETUR
MFYWSSSDLCFFKHQMISQVLYFLVLSCILPPCSLSTNFGATTLNNLNLYTRPSAIGESCMPPSSTCADPNSICYRKTNRYLGYCKCTQDYYYDRRSGKCMRSIAIGDPCTESRECQSFDRHSYCDYGQLVRKRRPICACISKYVFNHEKQRCVHCRQTLNDCRDPSSPSSVNSLAKYKRSSGHNTQSGSNQQIITTRTPVTSTSVPSVTPIQPSAPPLPSDTVGPMSTFNTRNPVRFNISSSIYSNSKRNQLSSSVNSNRLSLASSSGEDKPPSYEEAIHGSSQCKRDLVISLNPSSSLDGNPV